MAEALDGREHELSAIATEIRHDIEAADKHWQSAVHHAIRAGKGLIEAKSRLNHGEWLPWLEANFPGVSVRSAQGYLRLAENRNAVCAFADHPWRAEGARGAEGQRGGLPPRARPCW